MTTYHLSDVYPKVPSGEVPTEIKLFSFEGTLDKTTKDRLQGEMHMAYVCLHQMCNGGIFGPDLSFLMSCLEDENREDTLKFIKSAAILWATFSFYFPDHEFTVYARRVLRPICERVGIYMNVIQGTSIGEVKMWAIYTGMASEVSF